MNVKPGMKAAIDLRGAVGDLILKENDGIIVVVNELLPPGAFGEYIQEGYDCPFWVVTSISRPFVKGMVTQLKTPLGNFLKFKRIGTTWTVPCPDKLLRPIVEDKEPEKISEKAEA